VDVNDQLAKNYEVGGPTWRCAKWTWAVSNDTIERAADTAYQIYECRCERDELARASRAGDSPASRTRTRTQPKPIKRMSHVAFLESVAEDLILLAHNVQGGIKDDQKLALSGEDKGDPIAVLGLLARSSGTVRMGKRKSPIQSAIASETLSSGAGHCLVPVPADKKWGFNNPFCSYDQCVHAEKNKAQKCSEGSVRMQAGRSRCAYLCPACDRSFHSDCCCLFHHWGDYSAPPVPPAPVPPPPPPAVGGRRERRVR
jgi:hypothetical protein